MPAHARNYHREKQLIQTKGIAPLTGGSRVPLSFEQGMTLGRGGRILPSPVPNGYKPKTTRLLHSDSDDDDWC